MGSGLSAWREEGDKRIKAGVVRSIPTHIQTHTREALQAFLKVIEQNGVQGHCKSNRGTTPAIRGLGGPTVEPEAGGPSTQVLSILDTEIIPVIIQFDTRLSNSNKVTHEHVFFSPAVQCGGVAEIVFPACILYYNTFGSTTDGWKIGDVTLWSIS